MKSYSFVIKLINTRIIFTRFSFIFSRKTVFWYAIFCVQSAGMVPKLILCVFSFQKETLCITQIFQFSIIDTFVTHLVCKRRRPAHRPHWGSFHKQTIVLNHKARNRRSYNQSCLKIPRVLAPQIIIIIIGRNICWRIAQYKELGIICLWLCHRKKYTDCIEFKRPSQPIGIRQG